MTVLTKLPHTPAFRKNTEKNNPKFQSFDVTATLLGGTNQGQRYVPSEDAPNIVFLTADEVMENYQITIDGTRTYIQDIHFTYNGHLTWTLYAPELPLAVPPYLTTCRMITLDVKYSYTFLPASGIEGTINMLGTQDIRRSIAIIEKADLHIGVVSSLMHAAAAVQTPAIILFGGFERFSIHDYTNIIPFESTIPCSPCIKANTAIEKCPLNTQCMRDITPRMVSKKVKEILKQENAIRSQNN